MITHKKNIIKSYMNMEYSFSAMRLDNKQLIPVDWTMTITLIAPNKKSKSKKDIEVNATLAYRKIHFWLDTNVHNSIFVDVTNADDVYVTDYLENISIFCPAAPTDDLIAKLFHSKISKLAGSDLIVSEISIKGTDSTINYIYDCEDGNYELPLDTSYYVSGTARDALPWWDRDDGFSFEFIYPVGENGEEINDPSVFEGFIDPMVEFYKLILENASASVIHEPAKIVQMEKWKPRKVE